MNDIATGSVVTIDVSAVNGIASRGILSTCRSAPANDGTVTACDGSATLGEGSGADAGVPGPPTTQPTSRAADQ